MAYIEQSASVTTYGRTNEFLSGAAQHKHGAEGQEQNYLNKTPIPSFPTVPGRLPTSLSVHYNKFFLLRLPANKCKCLILLF